MAGLVLGGSIKVGTELDEMQMQNNNNKDTRHTTLASILDLPLVVLLQYWRSVSSTQKTVSN